MRRIIACLLCVAIIGCGTSTDLGTKMPAKKAPAPQVEQEKKEPPAQDR